MKTRRVERVRERVRVGFNSAQARGFVSRIMVRREGVSSVLGVSCGLKVKGGVEGSQAR